MIDTVLFDMGGTLEDIWVDDESRHSSIQGVLDILRAHGIDLNMDFETAALRASMPAGNVTALTGTPGSGS